MKIIKENIEKITQVCRQYHVAQLFVFGSLVKGGFKEDSDVDFLVYFTDDLNMLDYADNFFDFMHTLEEVLGRKADVVSGKAMRNPYFIEEVDCTKKLIYDRFDKKIAV